MRVEQKQNENDLILVNVGLNDQMNMRREQSKQIQHLLKMCHQRLILLDNVVRLHELRNTELIHRSELYFNLYYT